MAIGRISGSVLKSNLTRNGVDLAFETNLLYLDVTNSRVGIGTSEPATALHVVGNTTITGNLYLSGSFSPDTISVNNLYSTDSTAIQVNDGMNVSGTLTATGLVANGITYPSTDGTSNQVLVTNGSGTLSFTTLSAFTGITFVGDDSSGSTINTAETLKFTGATGITTTVVNDTVTITGPNLSSYLTAVPKTIDVNEISSSDSSAIQINDAVNISGTLTANTFVTNNISSDGSSAIEVNDGLNVSGTLTANTIQTNSLSSTESTAIQVNNSLNASGTITATSFVTHGTSGNITGVNNIELNQISSNDSTAVQVADGMNVSGTLTAPTFVTNDISSSDSTAIQVNDDLNVSGTLSADVLDVNEISSSDSSAIQINDAVNISGTLTAPTFVTNDISSGDSTAIQINDAVNISGALSSSGIKYPITDGNNGQFIKTDGAGNLTFGTVSTNSISQLNSNVTVTDAGTGSITIVADGATVATFDTATGVDASTSTKSLRLPNGATGDRPTGAAGMIRYNSTSDTIEGYTTAVGWAQLGATTAAAQDTTNAASGSKTAIGTVQSDMDTFLTSTYDSAWYLAVTRDEINEEVAAVKYSVVHNDSSAFITSSAETKSDTNTQITVNADVSGGNVRLLGTGTSVVNSISFYRLALGDNTTAGTSGNTATIINTNVDSATESLDSWSLSSYRGAKYFISVNNTTTNETANMECLVVHDGTNAYISTYNMVNSGNNDLLLLTADTDSSTVTLRASAYTPNCRVTMYRILLGDSETTAAGATVNIVGTKTVSSSATAVDSFANTDFTGCHYVVVGYNASEGSASASEVTVIASDDDAFVTGGPSVSTKGTDQLTFTAALSGTTVTLSAASTAGGSTVVNAYRVQLLRGIGGASITNTVLVNTTQTITGQKTFTAPIALTVGSDPTTVANTAHIYAKDESASAEVYVRDEAGNVTKISPHNAQGEWEYYSRNTKTGKIVRVNMEEMIRDLEQLTGKTYIKNE